jgi:hypothetical protein
MPPLAYFVCIGLTIGIPVYAIYWCWRHMSASHDVDVENGHNIGKCVGCGYDLRSGHDKCPDCGSSTLVWAYDESDPDALNVRLLSRDWPYEHIQPRIPGPSEVQRLLYKTNDERVAVLLSQQLHARGVWCTTREKSGLSGRGGAPTTYQTWHLVILEDDDARARAIVEHFKNKNRSATHHTRTGTSHE